MNLLHDQLFNELSLMLMPFIMVAFALAVRWADKKAKKWLKKQKAIYRAKQQMPRSWKGRAL